MSAPAPAYLAPDWRYAGDDWTLTYVVYETPPVYAADGSIETPGVLQPLAGYSVSGTLRYQSRCAAPAPSQPSLVALPGDVSDAQQPTRAPSPTPSTAVRSSGAP